ncbi:hypothetical protein M6B38_274490 [Iris pallida]|uniref:Uncharacterized protein n=1 Tax=Iris pallida TaxID=29817 RepID=A0AAX6I6C8_IRIPA|nr:hypothetical protein M6B38_274490 [Iris pallida]
MLLKRVLGMGERYSEKVAADIFKKIAGILIGCLQLQDVLVACLVGTIVFLSSSDL